jgi:hypothetical protein
MRIFNYKLFTGGRARVSFLVLLAKEMNAKKTSIAFPLPLVNVNGSLQYDQNAF